MCTIYGCFKDTETASPVHTLTTSHKQEYLACQFV